MHDAAAPLRPPQHPRDVRSAARDLACVGTAEDGECHGAAAHSRLDCETATTRMGDLDAAAPWRATTCARAARAGRPAAPAAPRSACRGAGAQPAAARRRRARGDRRAPPSPRRGRRRTCRRLTCPPCAAPAQTPPARSAAAPRWASWPRSRTPARAWSAASRGARVPRGPPPAARGRHPSAPPARRPPRTAS
eukprot:475140-Prymnesium_polylepis.1